MPADIPNELQALLDAAATEPTSSPNSTALWRRGRRRRLVKFGTVCTTVIVCGTAAGLLATRPSDSTRPIGIPSPPATTVFQTPDATLCSAQAAQRRIESFVDEFNSGDPTLVDESIAAETRLVFFQAPGFEVPNPPTTVRQGLTPYFQALHKKGDRLRFVSITAGGLDSYGDRGFSFRLTHITADGQQQPAGGSGSVECYTGKISALYLSW
jgi:hypothetical protein